MYSLRFIMGDTLSVRAWVSKAFMRIVTAIFEKMLWTDSGVPLTCAVSWVSVHRWRGECCLLHRGRLFKMAVQRGPRREE